MIEQRERIILRNLLAKGKITEEELIEQYDFYDYEIENIKNPRDWYTIYGNVDSVIASIDDKAVKSVLKSNWKKYYDYKEERQTKYGSARYTLTIRLTNEEFIKICEKGKEIREG